MLDVNPCAASSRELLPGDVLLRVDGLPVSSEGLLPYRWGTDAL